MKIKKLLLTLVFISTFTVLLGCFNVSDVQSIEFVTQPKLVYKVGEELDVQVKVTLTNGSQATYNINDPALTVKGFDTATPTNGGYRTLVVSYGSSSISAMYQVVDASQDPLLQYFGGKVEEGDELYETHEGYYKIFNAQHLSNIRYALDQNFVLMNDIDLAGIKWRPIGRVSYSNYVPNSTVTVTIEESFTGILDGRNFSILNLTAKDVDSPEWFVDPTYNFKNFSLFIATEGTVTEIEGVPVYSSVIKNLTVDIEVNTVSSVGIGAVATTAKYTKFDNVTITGSIRTAGNAAGIVGFYEESSYFNNCVNKSDITSIRSKATNLTSEYVFVSGITGQSTGTSYYINCANEGNLKHEYYNPLTPITGEICYSIMGNIVAQVTKGTVYYKDIDYSNSPTMLGNVANTTISPRFVGYDLIQEKDTTTFSNFDSNIVSLLFGYNHYGSVNELVE